MFRNMVTSFLEHEKITTTDAKAKELRSIAEKMVTLGKKGDLHAMRQAASFIRDKKVVTKLFTTIAPRYQDRPGGYTRIIKLGIRPGDNAPLSVIELVEAELVKKTPKKAPVEKTVPKAAVQKESSKPAELEETTAADEVVAGAVESAAPPVSEVKETDEECEAKAD